MCSACVCVVCGCANEWMGRQGHVLIRNLLSIVHMLKGESDVGAGLILKRCDSSDPAQRFMARAVVSHPAQQIRVIHLGTNLCVSSSTAPLPPPPIPPLPAIANLFRDQQGREIVVITSPGAPASDDTNVTAIVRGSAFSEEVRAEVVWPGARSPVPLTTVQRRGNGDVVLSVRLQRGAAVIRLYNL